MIRKHIRQWTIQFSQHELATLRHYFARIESGETQPQLLNPHQPFPDWNTVFLLLRKLLAFGVYHAVPTNPAVSYPALQSTSQKPDSMLVAVHTHFDEFARLLATCTAAHPGK